MDTTMTRHSRRRYVLFGALATLAITILMAVYSGPRIEAAMTHPTPRQSDRWFLETRTQPLVRDRWYVEAATQPAARDRWYIEAAAQPVAYDRWYLDMPGAREHSIK